MRTLLRKFCNQIVTDFFRFVNVSAIAISWQYLLQKGERKVSGIRLFGKTGDFFIVPVPCGRR
jgi:hypothetical protein